MEKILPHKNCEACLWFTDHRCTNCMFRKLINTDSLGVIDLKTYKCVRYTDTCPQGANIEKGFLWEIEEVK